MPSLPPAHSTKQTPSGDDQFLVTFDNCERSRPGPSFVGPRNGCILFREWLASYFATTAHCESGEQLVLPLDQHLESLDLGRR